eukprot:TRINITY_DN4458_c0_g1_i4.p1 TRINITY_DN4458_c0_g1~~TRINITY_DN4458_c0_g1_i4.p1  ORF type:complete len:306 (+),score=58.19 TRINITY_DN4458_c0_g1_i4:196-1113(+)
MNGATQKKKKKKKKKKKATWTKSFVASLGGRHEAAARDTRERRRREQSLLCAGRLWSAIRSVRWCATMDRMQFVPGAAAREELESANGCMAIPRAAALDYAERYLVRAGSNLYQLALAALSEGEVLEIVWDDERIAASVKASDGSRTKEVWQRRNNSSGGVAGWAPFCFDRYRAALAEFRGQPEPPAPVHSADDDMPLIDSVSRVFCPSELLNSAGAAWYFIVLATAPPVDVASGRAPCVLSEPMRAFDALVLFSILTHVLSFTPVCFSVVQDHAIGQMPSGFKHLPVSLDLEEDLPDGSICICG